MTVLEPTVERRTQFIGAPIKRVSWSSIVSGVVVGVAVFIALSMLGIALGLVESGQDAKLDATGGVSWAVIGALSLFVSGWTAGRLCGLRRRFEGALHGFICWAVTSVLLLTFAGSFSIALYGMPMHSSGDTMHGDYTGSGMMMDTQEQMMPGTQMGPGAQMMPGTQMRSGSQMQGGTQMQPGTQGGTQMQPDTQMPPDEQMDAEAMDDEAMATARMNAGRRQLTVVQVRSQLEREARELLDTTDLSPEMKAAAYEQLAPEISSLVDTIAGPMYARERADLIDSLAETTGMNRDVLATEVNDWIVMAVDTLHKKKRRKKGQGYAARRLRDRSAAGPTVGPPPAGMRSHMVVGTRELASWSFLFVALGLLAATFGGWVGSNGILRREQREQKTPPSSPTTTTSTGSE